MPSPLKSQGTSHHHHNYRLNLYPIAIGIMQICWPSGKQERWTAQSPEWKPPDPGPGKRLSHPHIKSRGA
eukprot:scaffold146565_cov18-Tisochrysis_lutea.AAC.1